MHRSKLLALVFTSLTITAHASDGTYFKFSDLLVDMDEDLAEVLEETGVKLYWDAQTTPEFAEVARADVYTRSGISLSPFGGSKGHCIEAFQKTLQAMIADAHSRGYDAITNIRAMHDGKPSDDPLGFICKPGYKTTEVPLSSSFAMTSVAKERATEAEQQSLNQPARSPVKGAIFLPFEPILNSPEAQSVLGPNIKAYAGIQAPEYSGRYGPDVYSEEADTKGLQGEEACKQAVLKTLSSMVTDAKERSFDSIIKIRSFLDEQFTPVTTDVECQVDKKTAAVTLKASLASRK